MSGLVDTWQWIHISRPDGIQLPIVDAESWEAALLPYEDYGRAQRRMRVLDDTLLQHVIYEVRYAFILRLRLTF